MANSDVQDLWKKYKVTKRLLNFIFNKGQCISQWGSFWNEYLHLGSLRYLIPEAILFYVPSATLPSVVILDIGEILHLWADCTEHIMCLNDQPEIALVIQGLTFPANSFRDLAFIIPEGFHEGNPPPEKFLIFFNRKKEGEDASLYLQLCLPKSLRTKIKWFHSVNMPEYWEEEVELLKKDETRRSCCTDSFGMVSTIIFLRCYVTQHTSGYGPPQYQTHNPVQRWLWYVYTMAAFWLGSMLMSMPGFYPWKSH